MFLQGLLVTFLVVLLYMEVATSHCQFYLSTLTSIFAFPPQVELLIPQLQFLDDEGAQSELWELSRIFLDTLIEETDCQVSFDMLQI